MSTCDGLEVIPTKAMRLRGQIAEEFTPIVFQEKKNSSDKNKQREHNLKEKKIISKVENTKEEIFDIRRARHDVIKFGLSGFEEVEKQKAQIAMAIKLGAKPPKREYKNYKEVQKERKQAKEAAAQQESFQTLGKKSTGEALFSHKKFTKNRRKRKDGAEVLKDYGKISSTDNPMTLATTKRRKR